jgi:hypothetical protein
MMNKAIAPYRPEVIDQQIENAQDDHKHNCTELGLETNHNHHTGDESEKGNDHSPDAPLATENEANEEEYQENSASKLKVLLPVLLVDFRQTSECLGLPDP